jgi:hypothetical protein
MEVMLVALDLVGFKKDSIDIQRKWDSLVKATGAIQTPMYRRACPQRLLEQAAIYALEGTKKIGCRIVSGNTTGSVHDLLNIAWQQFWAEPNKYHAWERDTITKLKKESLE